MKVTPVAAVIALLVISNVALAGLLISDRATAVAQSKEIFADSIDQMRFDGRVVHIDLARSRINIADGRRPSPAEREVVATVVLTSDAASLLYAGMSKAFAARPPDRTAAQSL